MLLVRADHAHHAAAADDLALVANPLDRRSDLHNRPHSLDPHTFRRSARASRSRGVSSSRTRSPTSSRTKFRPVRSATCAVICARPSSSTRYSAARQRARRTDRLRPHRWLALAASLVDSVATAPAAAGRRSPSESSGPSAVTATVCSKCADRLPSASPRSSRPPAPSPPACRRSPSARSPAPCPRPAAARGPARRSSAICGSSCSDAPMPCPTNSRTTENPCASTCCCTAWPMSETRPPGFTCVDRRERAPPRVTRSSVAASSRHRARPAPSPRCRRRTRRA